MRKMATIRRISAILDIQDADNIQQYVIDGWKVVDQKGKYEVGDMVVFCEIDSWIPHSIAPFLSKGKTPKEYNSVEGAKLRTIRLRGALSQGLLLPVLQFDVLGPCIFSYECTWVKVVDGQDVSETLGIQKYEPPIPAQLAGTIKGNFPSFIPKTGAERVQNVRKEDMNGVWCVTEKLEGSSMTCYAYDGEFGVCSKNVDLKRDPNNTFWKTALKYDLENKMLNINKNFAIQGEVIGPGIQGNIYNLKDYEFYAFSLYDIDNGEYISTEFLKCFCEYIDIKMVPYLMHIWSFFQTSEEWENFLEGVLKGEKSRLADTEREGVVFERNGVKIKAISNDYLLGK